MDLGHSFESWSKAVGINDHGVVVGWRQRGRAVCGFVWSKEHGVADIVGPDERNFYSRSINDHGLVVGEGEDSDGKRRTFTWTLDAGLKQLVVPDEFHPYDLDAHGNILGNIHSKPWMQPGMYSALRKAYFNLPSAYNHQTSVKAINNNGVVLGQAQGASTRHVHPLIWHLRQ